MTLVRNRFAKVEEAEPPIEKLLVENDDLDAVFVAWTFPRCAYSPGFAKGLARCR